MSVKKFAAAGVAGVASIALAMGAAGTAGAADGSLGLGSVGADNCGTTVVTPDAMNGWFTPQDEHKPVIKDFEGNTGDGAVVFGQSTIGTSLYKQVNIPLKDLVKDGNLTTTIKYDYTATGDSSNTPALQLRIMGANYGDPVAGESQFDNGFATIVWSPDASEDSWKTAEPGDSSDFWVTKSIGDDGDYLPRGEKASLADIISKTPNATLVAYGVNQTKENDSADVAMDKFVFGCETTDFEAVAPAPEDPMGSFDIFGSLSGISSDS